jgi:putative tricarboxylic transport membrane protein
MRTSADFKRGSCIALMFAIVLFGLIPEYVLRPVFIPGFAPPPDMWPRVVSASGMVLGILEMIIALLERRAMKGMSASLKDWFNQYSSHLMRFALACGAFLLFIVLIPLVGFLLASIFVGGASFILTGGWHYRGWMVGLTTVLPVVLYFLFKHFINTPFPKGSLFKALGIG